MKVIKMEDISDWGFHHTCEDCDSELEVEKEDLLYSSSPGTQREEGYESFQASCAVCMTYFDVPINHIPKLLQLEVKKRTNRSATNGYLDR